MIIIVVILLPKNEIEDLDSELDLSYNSSKIENELEGFINKDNTKEIDNSKF